MLTIYSWYNIQSVLLKRRQDLPLIGSNSTFGLLSFFRTLNERLSVDLSDFTLAGLFYFSYFFSFPLSFSHSIQLYLHYIFFSVFLLHFAFLNSSLLFNKIWNINFVYVITLNLHSQVFTLPFKSKCIYWNQFWFLLMLRNVTKNIINLNTSIATVKNKCM